MERAVAVKKLVKMFGKKFRYQIDPKAPTKEERAIAKTALPLAIRERNELSERLAERQKAILAADAEYQNLLIASRAAREHKNKLSGIIHHYKITVGIMESIFFRVEAQGDSWEEIIDKVTAKKRAA